MRLGIIFAIVLALIALTVSPAFPSEYVVTQLTQNDYADLYPQVSGNNVVWQGYDGHDYEIFLYDGHETSQLTNNDIDDTDARVSGNNVSWIGDGIFLYDGTATRAVKSPRPSGTVELQMSGNKLVWSAGDPYVGGVIDFFDGEDTTRLADYPFYHFGPQIDGDLVVWAGQAEYGEGSEIFLYNGAETIRLTDNYYGDAAPQISGDKVVWLGNDSTVVAPWNEGKLDVFLYDGSETTRLTDDPLNYVGPPQISGDNVVWTQDWNIFLFDGLTIRQLTHDGLGIDPRISGDQVIWNRVNEIMHYDGQNSFRITDNDYEDNGSDISGDSIVWAGQVGGLGSDFEIFLRKREAAPPVGTIAINNGNYYTRSRSVTISLSGSDGGGSGVDKMRLKNSGSEWTSWEDYQSSKGWMLTSGDGDKQVYYQLMDKAGNTSYAYSDTIMLDIAAPITALSSPYISTQQSASPLFKASWSATDRRPGSGVTDYDVMIKTGKKRAWKQLLHNTTKTSVQVKAPPGATYRLKARARDGAGNSGAWSEVRSTVVPYDETAPQVVGRIAGFDIVRPNARRAYNHSLTSSSRPGEFVVYKFNGDAVYLISTKYRDKSRARIYVDGKYIKTVDPYSKRFEARSSLFSKVWRRPGRHSLKVVNVGNRRRLDLDGLGVRR